jgi:hypothetical protein
VPVFPPVKMTGTTGLLGLVLNGRGNFLEISG